MFGLIVRFRLKPGGIAGFDQLVSETLPLIRQHEPGTLIYTVHSVQGEPTVRIFYELYRDREVFEEHERQEHVKRFLAGRAQYLDGVDVDFLTLQGGAGLPAGSERWL
jgi:quinol monooxygenase YgiN